MHSKDDILKRANELLAQIDSGAAEENPSLINEVYYGALTLLRVVHGPDGVQEAQLLQAMAVADKAKAHHAFNLQTYVRPAVQGALKALKADVEAGLTGNIVMQASGEILGDLLALAKEALADGGEPQKNVAAVLVAAAFEDTLRRLAEKKAGVTDRPKLGTVVGVLKAAGVLAGAAASTANGYLKFRNDSLHADWQNVQPPEISSCMAFTEGLLQQHFS